MDNLSPDHRHKNMVSIKSSNTLPERKIKKALLEKNLIFSENDKSLIGKPDIVFWKDKLVVFIDSDFWHGHPKRFILPKTNQTYWQEKIHRNKVRDKLINKELKKDGWKVIRIWDYDIKRKINIVISKIIRNLNSTD